MAGDTFNFEEAWLRNQEPATGRRAEAHRLATAMRRVIDHLVQVAAPEESLRAAADALKNTPSGLRSIRFRAPTRASPRLPTRATRMRFSITAR